MSAGPPQRTDSTPHPVRRGRRARALAFLVFTAVMAIAFLAGFAIARILFRSGSEPRVPARQAVLQRQLQGLEALVARAERGPIVPLGKGQAVLIVDEGLVRSLLAALVPAEHVIAGRYRIRVSSASASTYCASFRSHFRRRS